MILESATLLHKKCNDESFYIHYIGVMDLKKEIGRRIREAREVLGLKLKDVAEKTTNLSVSRISNYEQGERMPGPEEAIQLAPILKKSAAYLLCVDEGTSPFPEVIYEPSRRLGDEFVLVPRYDVQASMGSGAIVHSEQVVDHLAFKNNWVRNELGVRPENLLLINAIGDSMEPTLRAGDLLLIDHSVNSVKSDAIYVIGIDGELLAKRVQRLIDGTLIIKSDNPAYQPQTIPPSEIDRLRVIGRVVWIGRRA